jgi:predicted transcriptional regulator
MRLQDDNASFRINQTGLYKFLGDLECQIMELVWKKAKPTVTVRDIFESLSKERPLAYTTVMTTMVRLSEKGLLEIVEKLGLANCYKPCLSKEEFIKRAMFQVLQSFYKDYPDLLIDSLTELKNKPSNAKKRK